VLVHDWLTGMRGGEKCLETFCELFPGAPLYTLLHIPGSVSQVIEKHPVNTSFIQGLPRAKTKYRSYLPLFPTAIEQFQVRDPDLILSSSHCVAKGFIPHGDALHICYCHTPMRYVWAMYESYFGRGQIKGLSRKLIPFFAHYLRMWDVNTVNRVDHFIANSNHVRQRIWRYYRREAEVVYPPVETEHTVLSSTDDGFYLIVSAFAPYKRVDLAIEAFRGLNEKLVVVGTGQDEMRLKALAGSNVKFVGWIEAGRLGEYYSRCRALIFPGEEDFGIVPVEAQCYGKPVIALARGGALETVKGYGLDRRKFDSRKYTGVFFNNEDTESLREAIRAFSQYAFDPEVIRRHALVFDKRRFKTEIEEHIHNWMRDRN